MLHLIIALGCFAFGGAVVGTDVEDNIRGIIEVRRMRQTGAEMCALIEAEGKRHVGLPYGYW